VEFLAFENKHTIMLALTSNEGAFDFQTLSVDGKNYTSTYWKHLKPGRIQRI
jgi:orotidine-5'-phosphate decarboxylase